MTLPQTHDKSTSMYRDKWLINKVAEARYHRDQAIHHWIQFTKIVLEIKDSKLWRDTHRTWAEFVREVWDIDASRIRQFSLALPYAEKISQVTADIDLPESRIRSLRKAQVKADDPLMAMTYYLGCAVAQRQGEAIKPSHFKHARLVLEEETTTGTVEVDAGLQVPADFEDARLLAVVTSMDEARARQISRINSRPMMIKAKRSGINGQYWLSSETGDPLPAEFEFKIYLKQDMEKGQSDE